MEYVLIATNKGGCIKINLIQFDKKKEENS